MDDPDSRIFNSGDKTPREIGQETKGEISIMYTRGHRVYIPIISFLEFLSTPAILPVRYKFILLGTSSSDVDG